MLMAPVLPHLPGGKNLEGVSRPRDKGASRKIIFLISQPKHVVGTQKNRLTETK